MTDSANGAPAGGGQGDAGAGGGNPTPWYGATADAETVGYIQNRGWTNPMDVVSSYRNHEKLLSFDRAGRTVVLPKDDSPKEELDAFYGKLGRPESPDKYGIEIPKELGDENFAKAAAGKFHELGLSTKQAQELTKWWNGHVGTMTTQQKAEAETRYNNEIAELKTAQGAALEQNSAIVDQAAAKFGVDPDTLNQLRGVMGPKKTFELLLKIGQGLGEHSFEGAGGGSGMGRRLTPEQAISQINDLRKDADFVRKYTQGDLASKQRMEELHKFAYPDA